MNVGRYIFERSADAKGGCVLGHEIVQALHLALCTCFYFGRDNMSTYDSEVVNLSLGSLVSILPVVHFRLDKTVVGFQQLQSCKHFGSGTLVYEVNIGCLQNVFGRKRKQGLHQSQVKKEILDVFLIFLCP